MKVFSEDIIDEVKVSLTQCHFKCKLNHECISYGTLQSNLLSQVTDCYLMKNDRGKYSYKSKEDTIIELYVVEMVRNFKFIIAVIITVISIWVMQILNEEFYGL